MKKEVFDMNTKTMEQFEVMDVEMLASVEGGYSAGKCLADIGWGDRKSTRLNSSHT